MYIYIERVVFEKKKEEFIFHIVDNFMIIKIIKKRKINKIKNILSDINFQGFSFQMNSTRFFFILFTIYIYI